MGTEAFDLGANSFLDQLQQIARKRSARGNLKRRMCVIDFLSRTTAFSNGLIKSNYDSITFDPSNRRFQQLVFFNHRGAQILIPSFSDAFELVELLDLNLWSVSNFPDYTWIAQQGFLMSKEIFTGR